MTEPIQTLTKNGVPFCTFDDCRYHSKCGLAVTSTVRDLSRSQGVPIATYTARPRHCYAAIPEETENQK